MAGLVGAIYVGIAGFPALVAMADNILGYPFAATVVEDKVFSYKFIFQTQVFHLSGVFNNSALQLVNVFKSLVFVIGTGFFTADSAGAVLDQLFIFLVVF